MDRTLGFVGIGLMGFPMARRLLGAGRRVVAWSRDREKAARLVPHGGEVAEDLEALVRESDAILLCVSDTLAVCEVVASLCPHLRAGQLVIDFSSIEPGVTRDVAAELAKLGVGWVDAPVSGGTLGAENGTLAILAGGEDAAVARARAIAAPLGQRFTHVGPLGAGQMAKVCNQMIVACNAMVLAEVVALAESAGVDVALLPEALRGGFADSTPMQLLVPRMASRAFEPVQWRVKTLLKDLDTAAALSREHGASVPMTAAAAQLFRMHALRGHAESDPSTLVTLYVDE